MTGPIIGSALYAALGYERMFYVYGGFEVIFAIILKYGTPELALDEEDDDQEELVPSLKAVEANNCSNVSRSSLSFNGINHNRISIYSDQGAHVPIKKVIDEAKRNSTLASKRPSYSSLFFDGRYFCALIAPGL